MGKKDKAKKKSQPTSSNDVFKRVEEIYGTLLRISNLVQSTLLIFIHVVT